MNGGLSHFFRFVFLAASVVAACALAPESSQAQGSRGAEAGDFDYYVLSLSWSPTYCDTHGEGERGGRNRHYDRGRGFGGMADMAADMADMAAITSMTAAATMTGMLTGAAIAGGEIPTSSAIARGLMLSFCMVFGRNMSAEAGRRCANPTGVPGCRRKRSTG